MKETKEPMILAGILLLFLMVLVVLLVPHINMVFQQNQKNSSQANADKMSFFEIYQGMLTNPNEYTTPEFISSIPDSMKADLIRNLDHELFFRCENLSDYLGCDETFLYTFLEAKTKLNPDEVIPKNYSKIFDNAYQKVKKDFVTSQNKEQYMSGFLIPYLSQLCKINYLNQTEITYWEDNIINIDKKMYSTTDRQVFFMISCTNITNAEQLGNRSEKVCSLLSDLNFSDINRACETYDYLIISEFCNQRITLNDVAYAYRVVHQNQTSNYVITCQENILNYLTSP